MHPCAASLTHPASTFCATLVDEWLHCGLRHAVIAPGSRSTPLALALADRSEIAVHVFHDERSASFAALGIGRSSGIPAVLLCSSGTAAANFHPAVIEASMSAIPMVVCTADRPPELRDVGAAQTIDQTKLFGDSVRWFHDPGVAEFATQHRWRALAAQAWEASVAATPGPVHLNLAFREPLLGSAAALPPRRRTVAASRRRTVESNLDGAIDAVASLCVGGRGLILAGHRSPSAATLEQLATRTGWPILADPRSGVQHLDTAVCAADAILRSDSFAAAHRPSHVIRFGAPPASKVLAAWLDDRAVVQVHCRDTEQWFDPQGTITAQLTGDLDAICVAFADRCPVPHDAGWAAEWATAERQAQSAIDGALPEHGLSEPAVARVLAASMQAGQHLVVSSSMPIRDIEWYGRVAADVAVHANRGANGIDGVLATAIGTAIGSAVATMLLIGDVAVLHDSSSLTALAGRGLDLRIVVTDNDGGAIFNFLSQASELDAQRFEQLFGTPHGTDLVQLCLAHRLDCRVVADAAALRARLQQPGPHVTVVRSERLANVATHQAIHDAVSAAVMAE